ncbi:MAG: efflux RND transporter permease subunit [Nitrospirae bacterium]|nr:efflux RND transporter permease subunit [Nitrospirota bacterium]MCL5285602.1 efflux RND transporter permease subunit [Nitrospirota bacterium]
MSDRRETLALTNHALKHRALVLALLVGLCLVGVSSYLQLGVDLFPRVRFPLVSVTIQDPGEAPSGITEKIVLPVEKALSALPGVKHIHSTVVPGAAVVTAVFSDESLGGNPERKVREAIDGLSDHLPSGLPPPVISRENPTRLPLLWIMIPLDGKTGMPSDIGRIWPFVMNRLVPGIERTKGVRKVTVLSPPKTVVRIYLSAASMASTGLSSEALALQLREHSREYPAGTLATGGRSLDIDVRGIPLTLAGLPSFPVMRPSGPPVPLGSLARISEGAAGTDTIFRFEGRPAIALKVYASPGANLVRVSRRIHALLFDVRTGSPGFSPVPPGFRPAIRMDRSVPVAQNNRELLETLVLGAVLAVLVILVFLGRLRETAVAALAIPASVLVTFPLLQLFHFTLNNLTMLGLSLVVGILIDDAIVVLENIHRHRSMGESPVDAARFGVGEIGRAVLATTFSIVAVFAPMAMMHGVLGEFFTEFGWTVTFAVLASLVISLTVTPSLTLHEEEKEREANASSLFHRASLVGQWLADRYGSFLARAMAHPALVVLSCLILLGGSLVLGTRLGWNLIPDEDQGAYTVHIRMEGSPSLSRTDEIVSEISARVRALPGVSSVFQQAGGKKTASPSEGFLYVNLVRRSLRHEPDTEYMEKTRKILGDFSGLRGSVDAISPLGGTGASAPFQCFLLGDDPVVLKALSESLRNYLQKMPGLRDVNTSSAGFLTVVAIEPRPTNPPQWGITTGRLAQWISQTTTTLPAGSVRTPDGMRDMEVSMDPSEAASVSAISRLPFPVGAGRMRPLSEVARVVEERTEQRESRDDRMSSVSISANIYGGGSLGETMQKVDEWARTNLKPPYHLRYAGNSDVLNDARSQIIMAIIVASVVVFGLLSFQFRSLLLPFVIMLSMPFSLVGSILALWISGISVNMMGAIGLIILFGLVTKNAILLVDYANTLGRRGRSVRQSALESARIRLRPVAMTTLAMVFGMAPMAVGWGAGGEIRQSMAVVVIGGLLSSMFFTLVLVPVVYERVVSWRQAKGQGTN